MRQRYITEREKRDVSGRCKMDWRTLLRGKVKSQELLKEHTTFKIGGPAKFFVEPENRDDLIPLLNLSRRYKLPYSIIGAGSNILASDKGFSGIVIKLNSPQFKNMRFAGGLLDVGAGVLLKRVVVFAKERGLLGVEFLSGIPATVGGALIMNVGISERVKNKKLKRRSISDIVESVTVMGPRGTIKTMKKQDIRFGYRASSLSRYIILSAKIRLEEGNRKEINKEVARYLNYRKASQDSSSPNAGCIFKNPPGYSAGRLIDLCGFKGRRIGNARVSLRHANYILNLGNAKAQDVLSLMSLIEREVKKRFKITLEPEIKIWQN